MKELLVVVDMVNGFVNYGALADNKINKVTPKIEKLIKMAKEKNVNIIAFKDCHTMEDEEFKTFPPHCLKGTGESELIPELKKYEKDMVLINKNTTNGFKTKKFTELAKRVEYDKVVVCGCCTDICVKDFVTSYINFNKANNRKTKIVVVEDACYTFDGPYHNAESMHRDAITQMQHLGVKVITIDCKIKG